MNGQEAFIRTLRTLYPKGPMKTSPRFIMRIELTAFAKQKLANLSDEHGMTQVAMMSRLVEWFAGQDELIQSSVMGHYPASIESDVAKLILKGISS